MVRLDRDVVTTATAAHTLEADRDPLARTGGGLLGQPRITEIQLDVDGLAHLPATGTRGEMEVEAALEQAADHGRAAVGHQPLDAPGDRRSARRASTCASPAGDGR